jgi:antitoxin (DNA-binding transcriptional repressor) of toxin-antitoxin stability system
MERAAAGAEISVSRRGRPYVRMCGAGAGFKVPALAADE